MAKQRKEEQEEEEGEGEDSDAGEEAASDDPDALTNEEWNKEAVAYD